VTTRLFAGSQTHWKKERIIFIMSTDLIHSASAITHCSLQAAKKTAGHVCRLPNTSEILIYVDYTLDIITATYIAVMLHSARTVTLAAEMNAHFQN